MLGGRPLELATERGVVVRGGYEEGRCHRAGEDSQGQPHPRVPALRLWAGQVDGAEDGDGQPGSSAQTTEHDVADDARVVGRVKA